MPTAQIKIASPIEESFRVAQVRGMFDVPEQTSIAHEWDVNLPIEEDDWQLGLIVGPSGSGKSVLGRKLFPDAHFHTGYKWPKTAAVVDGFPKGLSSKDITLALSSVGFSSPPHWLKRFDHLSNGQKFRCELARLMLDEHETVVFDEFTSVVDRDAAKISAAAVAKALRRRARPRLVALSCHYDVIDWLDPDWVYSVSTGEFARRRERRRPPIELEIHAATHRAWGPFSGHHYLTRTIAKTAKCFVATWNGTPVAFTSYLPLMRKRNAKRGHRTVVLPDFQGVGIGNAVSEWLGAWCKRQGLEYRSTTSHPSMIAYRSSSPNWKLTRFGRSSKPAAHSKERATIANRRITARYLYTGPAYREHRTVVLPDFQGVGIGNAVSEWLGEHLARSGSSLHSTTSHPSMIQHRCRSGRWRLVRHGRVSRFGRNAKLSVSRATSGSRITASFEYVPAETPE